MAAYKLLEIATSENGTYTDVTDIITPGEFTVTPVQFAPKRAQSPMTGHNYGGLVATKRQLASACNPLTNAQTQVILPLVAPEYVWVNYRDPALGWRTGVKMLSGNAPAVAMTMAGGTLYWNGVSFTLTEV